MTRKESKMYPVSKMLFVAMTGGISLAASAATIRVPLDQPTIQSAINAAVNGDRVIVAPGTYFENINFLGKRIAVVSDTGQGQTIIDGQAAGSVVTFSSGETTDSVLRGFTLRNGYASFNAPAFGDGGGIRISNSSPTVVNNLIFNNAACAGGGISIDFGSPVVRNNVIKNNTQRGCSGGTGGGGIGIGGAGAAVIDGNTISRNSTGSDGGGISMFAAGTPTIRNNIIQENVSGGSGGGLWLVNQSDADIVQNLIIRNRAGAGGGIYWLVPSGARGPRVLNDTIADNIANLGSAIYADGFDDQALVANSILSSSEIGALYCGNFNNTQPPILLSNDVFTAGGPAYTGICGTPPTSNQSADPQFVASDRRDYHLRPTSKSIDAGSRNIPVQLDVDLDGANRIQDGDGDGRARIDRGVYELTPAAPSFSK